MKIQFGKKKPKKKDEPLPLHPHEANKEEPERLKKYLPVEQGGFFKKKMNKWKSKREDRCVLIHMELLNGFHKLFIVLEKDGGFLWRKKKYLFDNESKSWCIEAQMYMYTYHESFTLPIKIKIPIENIRSDMEYDHEVTLPDGSIQTVPAAAEDIAYGTNPETLHQFEVAKIADGIMRGADLQRFMTIILVVSIITLVILCGFLILFMFKTGMFNAVKNAATGATTTTLAQAFQR